MATLVLRKGTGFVHTAADYIVNFVVVALQQTTVLDKNTELGSGKAAVPVRRFAGDMFVFDSWQLVALLPRSQVVKASERLGQPRRYCRTAMGSAAIGYLCTTIRPLQCIFIHSYHDAI
jgi:hypothetical protein